MTKQNELSGLDSCRGQVLLVATFNGFLVTFMSSAVNIALPLIQKDFAISAVKLSWISLAYSLVAGAVLLPVGRASDLLGRVRLFTWGLVLFSLFSLASAFAPSANILLALRALHGTALGIGWATSAALVTLAYPVETRGRALGINVAGVYLGLTLGPVLGGIIVDNLGWRSLFLVTAGLGLLNLAAPLRKMRALDERAPKVGRFDTVGSFGYAIGLSALLVGFSLLPGVHGALVILLGVVFLAGFIWWETRASDPLLQVDLFRRNRVFAFSNVANLINYAATSAVVLLMSYYLQYNRALSAETAGLVLMASTLVQTAFSPVAGRLADIVKPKILATIGMIACAISLFALAFLSTTTPYWYIILVTCGLGFGYAFFSAPNTHNIMGSIERKWFGVGSATVAMMRLAGQNLSVGVATLVLAIQVGRHDIQATDYPNLLSGVRISFFIFAVLCLVGIPASLVGPRRART
jgi:EmrB/QacA subfamily drug resistance transporter